MVAQIDFTYIQSRPWKLYSRLMSYAIFEGRPLTTRGRWINPFLFAFFSVCKKLPAIRKVTEPIFILGTGRSGTTVLGIVLSIHKQVGFLNEPKALWHSIYPEEDIIGSYALGPAHYRLSESDAMPRQVRNAHRLFGSYLAATFSNRVVDKYPELIFRLPFVKKIFPDAKFIFLMRNGWDTCHSIEGWSGRLGEQKINEVHDWWGVNRRKWNLLVEQIVPEHVDLAPHLSEISQFTKQSDMAAVEWIVTMREGLAMLDSDHKDVIGVRFEDLSRQPEKVLCVLRDFLGLAEDPVFSDYGKLTLHPVKGTEPFDLHPLLEAPFRDTMKRLGYV